MKRFLWSLILIDMMVSITWGQPALSIIPEPVKLQQSEGYFEVAPETIIVANEDLWDLAQQLRQMLAPALGFSLDIKSDVPGGSNDIQLKCRPDLTSLGSEGYQLSVTSERVLIEAPQKAGLFYGFQTLRQLLPPEIFSRTPVKKILWQIPCVQIEDSPRFQWRGMHLDVSRHYFGPEFIKKYIDLLAMHKMNTFHWHLTDDQGWRIEIKQYPRLTKVGAWRTEENKTHWEYRNMRFPGVDSGQPLYGGYYTQEQIREIVAYAKQRYVTIIPEIEMPGHSWAALVAYPELTCTETKPDADGCHNQNVFCAGKEKTFIFLQNILDEVMELFPGNYIHIGGDEVEKNVWNDCRDCQSRMKQEGLENADEIQSWFIKRIEKYLNAHGRRLIGWDEILEGGLAPGATVMSWRGEAGGVKAAQSGHDVVMAPNSFMYFDYYQADPKKEPLAIGGFLPLERVYSYNPVPEVLTTKQQKYVLGVQGQVWTEYIATPEYVEYMAYPRACALAEAAWSSLSKKNYNDFYLRLTSHIKRLEALNVHFRLLDPIQKIVGHWKSGQTSETFQPMQWDVTSELKEAGNYNVRFQYTGGAHRLDIQSVELLADDKRVAKDQHLGITGGMTRDNTYSLPLNHYDPSSRYTLRAVVRSDGGTDSNGDVCFTKE